MKKKVIVLGITGTIGKNTTDVINAMPENFQIVAMSAHKNEEALLALADQTGAKQLALTGKKSGSGRIKYFTMQGLIDMVHETEADIVVNGIAGADGLLPSVASIESGKNLALANKESIVMAGSIVSKIAAKKGKKIIPVDSEHSAVFHLLQRHDKNEIDEIILTASGGAFRELDAEEMKNVTLEDALKHPNWSMGQKITIDSASLANKGLEVIEAYQLFGIPLEKIRVLIHRQSMVHSLIRTREGSLYAQISKPDMRIPIQNALTWPELGPSIFGRLDLEGVTLDFSKPDFRKYPMLALAYSAAGKGAKFNIAYNAANEVAVDAFMKRETGFNTIPEITAETLSVAAADRRFDTVDSVEQVMDADRFFREEAKKITGDFRY